MFSTTEQVAMLKKRARSWQAVGYPGADPLIPAVMDLVLQLDHIAPVWSCEGHSKDPARGRMEYQNFYMIFAVEESGFPIMQKIYLKLRSRLIPYQQQRDAAQAEFERRKEKATLVSVPPALPAFPAYSSIVNLDLRFTNRVMVDNNDTNDKYEWYNAMILNGQTHRKSAKEIFFKEFLAVLNEVVENK